MKIFSKMKKILLSIGTFFMMIPVKIYGVSDIDKVVTPLYGVERPPEKVEPTPFVKYTLGLLEIMAVFLVPILILMGAIVIYKKSTFTQKVKLIVTGLILILLCIYIGAIVSYFLDGNQSLFFE